MTAGRQDTPPAAGVHRPEKNYRGVRGWLLLLCFLMVLVAPAQRGYVAYGDLNVLFALQTNTTMDEGLAGSLRSAVSIEAFLIFCSALLSLAAGISLLMEKRFAPRLAIVFWASGPLLNLLLLLSVWSFFPSGEMFDDAAKQIGRDFVSSILGAALWISYLCKSKRVKATYASGAATAS